MNKSASIVFMLMCLLMACATGYSQQATPPDRLPADAGQSTPPASDNYKKSVDDANKLLQKSIRLLATATTPEQVDDILRRQPGGADPTTFMALKEAALPLLKTYNPKVFNQLAAKNNAELREPTTRTQVSPEATRALAETKASPKLEGVHDSQKSAPLNVWFYHYHLSFLLPRSARLAVRANDEQTPFMADSQRSKDSESWPQFKISSIAKSSGRKIAMINGNVVGVGDEVNGAILTEIKDFSVTMKKGMETREFQVGK